MQKKIIHLTKAKKKSKGVQNKPVQKHVFKVSKNNKLQNIDGGEREGSLNPKTGVQTEFYQSGLVSVADDEYKSHSKN